MQRVIRSTILPCTPDTVWAVLRDFGGEADWHPSIASAGIDRGQGGSDVGCTRQLKLADGADVCEKLLTLSDLEMAYSYCMLDTTVPLFNYIAHVHLYPVTDEDHTFWEWRSSFHTREGEEEAMTRLVAEGVYETGFRAMRQHLGLDSTGAGAQA